MPTAWGICPYEVVTDSGGQYRQCAAERYRAQILADNGALSYAEILGNHGLVKVRASTATLTAMNAEPGFVRIPKHWTLTDSLSDLTGPEKTALKNKLLALGYTLGELEAALSVDMGQRTLGDLLRFACSRWRRPLSITDGVTIFELVDFPRRPRSVESVDGEVT